MPRTKAFVLLLLFCSCTTVPPPAELSLRSETIADVRTSVSTLPRVFDFGFANPKSDLIALLRDDYITFVFICQKLVSFHIQVIDKQSGQTICDWKSFVVLKPGVGEDVAIPVTDEMVIGALQRKIFEVRATASQFFPAKVPIPFVPKSMTFTKVSPEGDEHPRETLGRPVPLDIEEF